jgi:hypothetical protein
VLRLGIICNIHTQPQVVHKEPTFAKPASSSREFSQSIRSITSSHSAITPFTSSPRLHRKVLLRSLPVTPSPSTSPPVGYFYIASDGLPHLANHPPDVIQLFLVVFVFMYSDFSSSAIIRLLVFKSYVQVGSPIIEQDPHFFSRDSPFETFSLTFRSVR